LHENGTSRSAWHASQRKRAKPLAQIPHVRNWRKFALDEQRDAAGLFGRPQKGRQVHPDHVMQHRVLGGAWVVSADARGRAARGHPPSWACTSGAVDR
jgi:hypothetical protein